MNSNKKAITFREFMSLQTRWIALYAASQRMDIVDAAIQIAPIMRQKIEKKYIII
jgi:hypothetical protein